MPARRYQLLGAVALLGGSAAVAGIGTFGTFTSTVSATTSSIATATVTIALGATNAATNRLTVGATGLVPGDTMQRSFDLTNSGTANLASVTLTTTAPVSSQLDTDATNGLQLVIDRCSVAWTETGPPYTYTCSGSTATIVASRAVIGSGVSMSGLSALTAGGADHLRATLTLPSAAGNTLQGQSSTVQFSFTGTQRTSASQ